MNSDDQERVPSEPEAKVASNDESAGGGETASPAGPSLAREVEDFVRSLEALRASLSLSAIMVQAGAEMASRGLREFTHLHGEVKLGAGGDTTYSVPLAHAHEFSRLTRTVGRTQLASRSFPRAFLVALVSQYDAYLGRLLRGLFLLRPETLAGSERQLTAADVLRAESLADLQESIVEKEVETFLRESHVAQFEWLEKRFALSLRKDLSSWKDFVEVTERRNLFVHTDGVVSSQYLRACDKEGCFVDGERPKLGETLRVTPDYFDRAYRCLFEIGVKLAHVLWRKLLPEQRAAADASLTSVSYELILEKHFLLAKELLRFGVEVLKKHHDETSERTLVVNLAQTMKWLGDEKACAEILGRKDWSACSDKFQIAVAVLRDDYAGARELMRQAGARKGAIEKEEYLHWPLFQRFRESDEFKTAFEELFGEAPLHREQFKTEPAEASLEKRSFADLDDSFRWILASLRDYEKQKAAEAKAAEPAEGIDPTGGETN